MTVTTFATIDELAVHLGRLNSSELTAAHLAQGQMLLELVTGIIVAAVGRDDEWAAALDPVPTIVRAVVLGTVARVMTNPTGARSESETLGAHSHTTSYTDGAHGLMPDDAWIALCRRAVWGRLSASTMPGTTLDLAIELCETGEIAAFPAT